MPTDPEIVRALAAAFPGLEPASPAEAARLVRALHDRADTAERAVVAVAEMAEDPAFRAFLRTYGETRDFERAVAAGQTVRAAGAPPWGPPGGAA